MCQALAEEVEKYRSQGIHILKDVSLANKETGNPDNIINIKNKYNINGNIFMYIGNLESYQGIDLMIDAFSIYYHHDNTSRLVIIGGVDEHIQSYKEKCQAAGLGDAVIFMGKQPIADINAYMSQADILLSPRIHGVNTPMKVYSYLDSGVAVLATNLPTHTQVADKTNAYLAQATPEALAKGMQELSKDPMLAKKLADNAKKLIEKEHSYPAFKNKLYEIYDSISVS